jgi:hypothetical protein
MVCAAPEFSVFHPSSSTPDIMFRACRCVTIRLGQGIAIVPCAEHETKMLKMLKMLKILE